MENGVIMVPDFIPNFINGKMVPAQSGSVFANVDPANGRKLANVALSSAADVEMAIESAQNAFKDWKHTNIVKRGDLLREISLCMQERKEEIAKIMNNFIKLNK